MNGPITPAWRVTLEKLSTTDYYFGATVDGTCYGSTPTRPCIAKLHPHRVTDLREWWGWPDIDVPLPLRQDTREHPPGRE